MCTVTFIPFKDSFYLTSNRDESPGRKAKGLVTIHSADNNAIYFPLDEESGGSWIALSNTGRVTCLLNGAFESFNPAPPYRQSRGKVVTDAITEPDTPKFLSEYDLNRIAPFTLLIFEKDQFIELIWDERKKHIRQLSVTEPQIWSSVTLYPQAIRERRKSLFTKWISENSEYNRESIIQFHHLAHGDPHNDFIMNRNEVVKTLSVTNIELTPQKASIMHLDIEKNVMEEIMVIL